VLQGGRMMPIITISMDDEAYDIVRSLPKRTKSSSISAAIKIWHRHCSAHSPGYIAEFDKEMNDNE